MFSSTCCLTEDQTIKGVRIRKGDLFSINMFYQHWNKAEWIEPEKFIPDRFDPESPYFLTPSGTKRHNMSFGPFLGGKRICLGKTFAESASKVVGPYLIYNFDFKFVNEINKTYKPANNINNLHEPTCLVTITQAKF